MISIYLIYGDDDFQVSEKARELIEQIVPPEQQTLGLEIINGQANRVADAMQIIRKCIEAICTIGFVGGRKVVWLRGATFFDKGIVGQSKSIQETVAALNSAIISGMPENHMLIITAQEIDIKSSFFKNCKSCGKVIHFEASKPWLKDKQATKYAKEKFRHYGLHASQDVITTFVEKVGTNTRQIEQEISKLSVFLDTRKDVNRDDIDSIVCATRGMIAWDIEDAVATGDLKKSIKIARNLLFHKNDPIKIITFIEKRFKYLSIFREALDNKWFNPATAGKTHSSTSNGNKLFLQALSSGKRPMHPFVMKNIAEQAAKFSQKELNQCQKLILKTRIKLVSSSVPAPFLLEMLIIRLCNRV